MSEHGAEPDSLRELLRFSQTNVTADPELGLQYAAAAYDKAGDPELHIADPTAAGEAAAKAALRAEQAGYDRAIVDMWLNRSYSALADDDPRMKRERVATHLLEGRTLALRLLLGKMVSVRHDDF